MAEDDFYIIGIDFGTTYTGVAWCWSGKPDVIDVVSSWKTRQSYSSDIAQTPTEIYYDRSSGNIHWGYDIPPEVEPIRWFKLLLVDENELSPDLRNSVQIQRARKLVKEHGKSPTQVIADYLRLLWAHITDTIIRARGSAAFRGSPLKVWLTIPAIWGEAARRRMRDAAGLAGILDARPAGETILRLVAEPEAAAMAVLDDFQRRPDVEMHDVYIVCDAGGGTVDIISYMITQKEPLQVKECVEGRGKMCGAIFIDAAFESMLRTILGDKWKKIPIANQKSMFNSEWENGIKRSFDDSDREWSVSVPSQALSHSRFRRGRFDEKKGEVPMRGGELKFRSHHIRRFFGAVIPDIRTLILDQVESVRQKYNMTPKAILLVGGLGSCRYLHEQIRREFEINNIMVLQSANDRSWTAICRGAVIRGLSDPTIEANVPLVTSHVSRANYGTTYYVDFDERKHLLEDRTWKWTERRWVAENQMRWYLKRGDDMYTERPVVFSFFRLYEQLPESFSVEIFENSELQAPSRKTRTVKPLVTINVYLTTPFEEFPVWMNPDGKVLRKIRYSIYMSSDGVTMFWKVLINGVLQGSSNVQIIVDPDDTAERYPELKQGYRDLFQGYREPKGGYEELGERSPIPVERWSELP